MLFCLNGFGLVVLLTLLAHFAGFGLSGLVVVYCYVVWM